MWPDASPRLASLATPIHAARREGNTKYWLREIIVPGFYSIKIKHKPFLVFLCVLMQGLNHPAREKRTLLLENKAGILLK